MNYYNYYPTQSNAYPTNMSVGSTQPTQGFVSVRSEQEARNYPIAPGNSITFKDENSPYVYTKTMGFSQLDRPSFEKYKLVKEDVEEVAEPCVNCSDLKSDINKLWNAIDEIKATIEKPTSRRKKETNDDSE